MRLKAPMLHQMRLFRAPARSPPLHSSPRRTPLHSRRHAPSKQCCVARAVPTKRQTSSPTTAEETAGHAPAADAAALTQGTGPAVLHQNADRVDLYKAVAVGTLLSVVVALLGHDWVAGHQEAAMAIVFAIGYWGIIVEDTLGLNKAGVALLMAVSLWTIRASGAGDTAAVEAEVSHAVTEVSDIVFFLLGAMTIVEEINCHQGFEIISRSIRGSNRITLLWLVGIITFFMSSVLDNLTTTIVMVSVLQKLCQDDPEQRRFLGAVVVIAANAGGAWTPIGDVTTTMLWINGQLSTLPTLRDLLLPSLASLVVPMLLMSRWAPEVVEPGGGSSGGGSSSRSAAAVDMQAAAAALELQLPPAPAAGSAGGLELAPQPRSRGALVLATGVAALLAVPAFRQLTGLPPFLGMLSGLGVVWLLTDALHYGEDRRYPTVSQALKKVDMEGVMFFMGVLLAVAALDAAGILQDTAAFLGAHIKSPDLIAAAIGVVSAVVDNVPLVAATMGMYDLAQVPMDSELWQLVAYCAGTGGSLLVIGSAAGVAYMGLEKATFGWYLRRVTPWALVGYLAGIATYLAGHSTSTGALLAAASGAGVS